MTLFVKFSTRGRPQSWSVAHHKIAAGVNVCRVNGSPGWQLILSIGGHAVHFGWVVRSGPRWSATPHKSGRE